jgi:mono/diheme cytochrome c family protein
LIAVWMKHSSQVAAALLALLVCNEAHAGAGPPVAPPPPKEALTDPNDPNAEAAAPGAVPASAIPPADSAQVEKGLRMYKDYCQKCHGMNMVSPGGGFFDLRTFPRDDRARFINSVTNGKRAMPAWGAVLKPADIDTLWAYVSSGGQVK